MVCSLYGDLDLVCVCDAGVVPEQEIEGAADEAAERTGSQATVLPQSALIPPPRP